MDVSQVVRDIPHTGPHNLISGLIERFADYRGALEKAAADRQRVRRLLVSGSGRRCRGRSTSMPWR